ncbi:MAG: GAF domain-containing protein [Chloroflexota bacterium]
MNLWQRVASLPLRLKLIVAALVSILVAISVLGLASTRYSQIVPSNGITLLQELTRERLDTMNTLLTDAASTTIRLTNDPIALANYATLSIDPENETARQTLRDQYHQVINAEPAFNRIRFVSLKGQALAVDPIDVDNLDETQQNYYKTLKTKLPIKPIDNPSNVFVDILESPQTTPNLNFVVIPVVNAQPLGYVVVNIDASGGVGSRETSIYKSLLPTNTSVGKIAFYLLTSRGTVIVPVQQPVPANEKTEASIQQLINLPEKPFQYISPLTGQSVFGLAVPFTNTLDLTLVAEIPSAQLEASAESSRFYLPLLGGLAAGILIIILLGVFLDVTVVQPTETLLEVASRSVLGRSFDDMPVVNQKDELGRLFTAFVLLTNQLREDVRDLDNRITGRTNDIEASRDIGQTLSGFRTLDPLLGETVRLLRQHFDKISHAQIFLVDPERQFALPNMSTAFTQEGYVAQNQRWPINDQNLIGATILEGQLTVALNTTMDPRLATALLPHMRAELVLPLMVGRVAIGVLDLQSVQVDAFADTDIQLFSAIANQLTIAVTNAQFFEESQTRLHEIEALNQQLSGDVWRKYLEVRHSNIPAASTALLGGKDVTTEWSALQRQAIETGEIIEQVEAETVTFALPITLRGQVLGAVEWDVQRVAYNDNVRQLAYELASRLAISADNARLFEQAQRLAQRERLVNDIASKLTQQTDVSEILKVAVREVGQALHVPQTSIRLATNYEQVKER